MSTVTDVFSAGPMPDNLRPDDRRDGVEAVVLAWRVHRLRENPRGIALAAGAYAAAFILWRLIFPHPLALVLPLFALTGALSDYLFPISYRLTTRGAYADCGASRLFLSWSEVRRATYGAEGIHLSPFARPHRLDSFRGVRLRFDGENQAAVIEAARALWRDDRSVNRSVNDASAPDAAMGEAS